MKKFSFLVLGALIFFASAAYADKGCPSCAKSSGSLADKFFTKIEIIFDSQDELALSEDQVKILKDLKYAVKRAAIQKESAVGLAKLDLYQELYNDKPDLEKINALIDSKMEAKTNFAKTTAKAIVDVKSVLTEAQMKKLKELYAQKKKRGCSGKDCPLSKKN